MRFPTSYVSQTMRLTKGNLGKLVLPAGKTESLVFDEDLSGFGLRIRAGGKRTWDAQYRLGTKQRRVTLGTPETVEPDEARKRAKEALAKVSLGGDPQSDKYAARAAASVTLGSIVPKYLAHAVLHQSANYHADVKRYLEVHWAPLAETPVAKIDRVRVSLHLDVLSEGRGAHSADRARAALSSLFSWALGEGLADRNPTVDTNRPVQPQARKRMLTDAELVLVWNCAGQGHYGNIVRLLILTACRREEVGSMAWSELQGSTWTIPDHRAKNGLPLELPLAPCAAAIIAGVSRRDDRDFIFGSRAGPFSGWSKSKAELDERMLAALKAERGSKAALIPWRHHDLRRTAATRMGDLGVQPHVVEAVLNHVSGSKGGIAGVYNHATYRDEKRAALAVWAGRVEKLLREQG